MMILTEISRFQSFLPEVSVLCCKRAGIIPLLPVEASRQLGGGPMDVAYAADLLAKCHESADYFSSSRSACIAGIAVGLLF